MKRLLVINGHPDPRPERFCGALCSAYERGGDSGGWETRRLNIGELSLSSIEALSRGENPGADVLDVLGEIDRANRLAIVYPLWYDQPPPALRAIFDADGAVSVRPGGRKAHIIVTMEMPAFAYRSMLRPGAPKKALALSIPGVVADEPVLIGCVSAISNDQRRQWLKTVREYGQHSSYGAAFVPSRTSALVSSVAQWWNGSAALERVAPR